VVVSDVGCMVGFSPLLIEGSSVGIRLGVGKLIGEDEDDGHSVGMLKVGGLVIKNGDDSLGLSV
jgi:hypothetical protein